MCAEAEDQVARAAEVGATGLVVPVEMEGSGEVKDLATLEKLAGVASAKGIAIVPEIRCCDHTPGGDSAALAGALRGVSAAADTSVALVAGSVSWRSPIVGRSLYCILEPLHPSKISPAHHCTLPTVAT